MDRTYDKLLKKVAGIKWLPWIGDNFTNSTGKFLIIGESHYKWKAKDEDAWAILNIPTFTRKFISHRYITRKFDETIRILDGLLRAINNKNDISYEEKKEFVKNISYCVLVQRPLRNIKKRPNKDDFLAGWKTISGIIRVIKPKNIIFLGTTAVKNLLNNEDALAPLLFDKYKEGQKINGTIPRKFILKNGLSDIKCLSIRHPSWYFSWGLWNKYIRNHMNIDEVVT